MHTQRCCGHREGALAAAASGQMIAAKLTGSGDVAVSNVERANPGIEFVVCQEPACQISGTVPFHSRGV
jgi:hypothetical protein